MKKANVSMLIAESHEVSLVKAKEEFEKEKEDFNTSRSAKESILVEREKRIGRISDGFSEREKAIIDRQEHVRQFMEIKEKQVANELDRARKILEEAKAIQIKNKKQ
jgi:hypothetical protein